MANSRNRTAGHSFEREIVKVLADLLGIKLITTRLGSKRMDDKGIDVMPDIGEVPMPFDVQCKNTASAVNYHKLIQEMPSPEKSVVFHNRTEKSKGGKFITKGQYVIMPLELFTKLFKK